MQMFLNTEPVASGSEQTEQILQASSGLEASPHLPGLSASHWTTEGRKLSFWLPWWLR